MLNRDSENSAFTCPSVNIQRGSIARIVLNRPDALNALNAETAEAFRQACETVIADKETRVLIISGAGRAFSAGGDVAEMHACPSSNPIRIIEALHHSLLLLEEAPIVVISQLHGIVAGGAVGLALMCDLAIASANTRFNLAYAQLGASCDCGTSWVLPRLMGWRQALKTVLLQPNLSAEEALNQGLISHQVPEASLEDAVNRIAVQLSTAPKQTIASAKKLMRRSLEHTLAQQLNMEAEHFAACTKSADFVEGLAAFVEKRKPVFGQE